MPDAMFRVLEKRSFYSEEFIAIMVSRITCRGKALWRACVAQPQRQRNWCKSLTQTRSVENSRLLAIVRWDKTTSSRAVNTEIHRCLENKYFNKLSVRKKGSRDREHFLLLLICTVSLNELTFDRRLDRSAVTRINNSIHLQMTDQHFER